MPGRHRHATAAIADILHRRQLVFADMPGIDLGRTTETAFGGVPTGVAEVPRSVRNGATILAGVGHMLSSFPVAGNTKARATMY
jgi:hypothetical protein